MTFWIKKMIFEYPENSESNKLTKKGPCGGRATGNKKVVQMSLPLPPFLFGLLCFCLIYCLWFWYIFPFTSLHRCIVTGDPYPLSRVTLALLLSLCFTFLPDCRLSDCRLSDCRIGDCRIDSPCAGVSGVGDWLLSDWRLAIVGLAIGELLFFLLL